MKTKQPSRKLNRYTTLPVLLDLLRRKKIVLLDPSTWEDRNDAELILEYKRRKKIPQLFAICFGIRGETIHHWKTYASGVSGCCIEFDENKLLEAFRNIKEARWDNVVYMTINEAEKRKISRDRIPFTKRWPYRYEKEFRIVWEGKTSQKTIDVDINLKAINKITLSQGLPADVYESIKELLRDEFRDPSKKINRSTLYENKRWIGAFRK